MKRILLTSMLAAGLCCLPACQNFFDPDYSTTLDGNSYMQESSELYSGYLGVITKLQAVGDKAIYLTDTRAEMLEPTGNCDELTDLYNYEPDLAGNSYADPAKYYDLVIACNDYLAKAKAYREAHSGSVDPDHYQGLVSCIVRLKTWTYFTLARIYGQAVWFDDPMLTFTDLGQFPVLNLQQTLDRCDAYLEEGFDGIDGQHNMDWAEWILTSATDDQSSGNYYNWDKMVPDYFVLAADIALWQGRYQQAADLVLNRMNEMFESIELRTSYVTWCCGGSYSSSFSKFFDNTAPSSLTTVDVIVYNYANGQSNQLLWHFYNNYMLRPSEAGVNRYDDFEFNPRLETKTDGRRNVYLGQSGDKRYFHKYRRLSGSPRSNVKQDDVHIYLYRSAELYFILAEAMNHLGRFREAYSLINDGVSKVYVNEGLLYEGFSDQWTTKTSRGARSYADSGIRGIHTSYARDMWYPQNAADSARVAGDVQFRDSICRYNDMEILKEILLEMPGEGKTYNAMVRMARCWNDYGIVADNVCPKYTDEAKRQTVRQRILDGGYFVPWDLEYQSTNH